MKKRKIAILLLLLLALVACGGVEVSTNEYQPATKALEAGDSLSCPNQGNLTITKINEDTLVGEFNCIQRNSLTSQNETVSSLSFTAPKTDEIFALTSKTRYNWGVVVREGRLIQVFQMHSQYPGQVLVLWPPPGTQEE